MGITAAVVAGAVALGSTAYQMKSAADQRSDAEAAANDQAKKEQDAEEKLKQQQSDETAAAAETQSQQQARQRALSTSNQGYQGTILAGSLGVPGSSANTVGGGKTLLGM